MSVTLIGAMRLGPSFLPLRRYPRWEADVAVDVRVHGGQMQYRHLGQQDLIQLRASDHHENTVAHQCTRLLHTSDDLCTLQHPSVIPTEDQVTTPR